MTNNYTFRIDSTEIGSRFFDSNPWSPSLEFDKSILWGLVIPIEIAKHIINVLSNYREIGLSTIIWFTSNVEARAKGQGGERG